MSDVINVGKRAKDLDDAPRFAAYSKVVIHIDDETVIEVGNNSGRTLEVDNPFGTQAMAQNMLTKLQGYQYQPFVARDAILDPAAEMGDAADMLSTYGGIYTRKRSFDTLMRADISAPSDEEVNHEFQYESPIERKFVRETKDIKATLLIQENMIQAEVSARESAINELSTSITQTASELRAEAVAKTGGSSSTFGWSLTASGFKLYSGGSEVFLVDSSGASIKGTVRATAGLIGGFTIGSSALQYNGLEYGATDKNTGIYIGTRGIQLGKSFQVSNSGGVTASNLVINGGSISIGNNFRVDSAGNVSAVNMTLSGTLNIGGRSITAEQLQQGAASAYSNGSYWSGGAGGGYNYTAATQYNTGSYPNYFTCGYLSVRSGMGVYGALNVYNNFSFGGRSIVRGSIKDHDGNTQYVLKWV